MNNLPRFRPRKADHDNPDSGIVSRLKYGLIGLVIGSVVSAIALVFVVSGIWGASKSSLLFSPVTFLGWTLLGGSVFGLVGFILKDRVGDVLGDFLCACMDPSSLRGELPTWVKVVAFFGVIAILLIAYKSHGTGIWRSLKALVLP